MRTVHESLGARSTLTYRDSHAIVKQGTLSAHFESQRSWILESARESRLIGRKASGGMVPHRLKLFPRGVFAVERNCP